MKWGVCMLQVDSGRASYSMKSPYEDAGYTEIHTNAGGQPSFCALTD